MPILAKCPSCQRKLRVPDNLIGRKVKCPGCGRTLTAAQAEDVPTVSRVDEEEDPPVARRREVPLPEEEEVVARRRRPAPPPEEDDEPPPEEADEEEPRPRRQRRRRRSEDAARSAVAAPAIALIVVSSLAIVLHILTGISYAANLGLMPKFFQQDQAARDPAFVAGELCGVGILLCFNVITLTAAIKMKQLSNYHYARTGAFIALLPCLPACLLSLPFGIWALVVLSRYEVKEAFT